MCCPIYQIPGTIHIKQTEKEGETLQVKGYIDWSPKNIFEKCLLIFRNVAIIEAAAEILDEGYHFAAYWIQPRISTEFFEILDNLHVGAHQLHDISHAFGALRDIFLICSGHFLEYKDKQKTQIDYGLSAARFCHFTSHSLAMLSLLSIIFKIKDLGPLNTLIKYNKAPTAVGYAISLATLNYRYYQTNPECQNHKKHISSQLRLYGSGLIFETLSLLNPKDFYLDKLRSLAGIIHAWGVCMLLMPQQQEKFKINLRINL